MKNIMSNRPCLGSERLLLIFPQRGCIYASAESFNAKIKAFRSQFRGVRKIDFFLFTLFNLFA